MTTHPTPGVILRYAAGDATLDDVGVWSVEAHLETCAPCRALLADRTDPSARSLLARVAGELDRGIAAGPPPAPVRGAVAGRRGAVRAMLPWLLTVAGVLGVALIFDRTFPAAPSLVLMVAPVAPLLAVAAAWSRGTDPAWEIISATPRAGLRLLLSRALAGSVLLVPVLALVGWCDGQQPVLWLLPCLAFSAGTLALGGVIGVSRAATVLAGVWALGVVLPGLVTSRLPFVLRPDSWLLWTVATVVLGLLVAARADDHRRMTSRL